MFVKLLFQLKFGAKFGAEIGADFGAEFGDNLFAEFGAEFGAGFDAESVPNSVPDSTLFGKSVVRIWVAGISDPPLVTETKDSAETLQKIAALEEQLRDVENRIAIYILYHRRRFR